MVRTESVANTPRLQARHSCEDCRGGSPLEMQQSILGATHGAGERLRRTSSHEGNNSDFHPQAVLGDHFSTLEVLPLHGMFAITSNRRVSAKPGAGKFNISQNP
mmetsp:Transcript_25806/g.59987  ORF Transcript_25806/g.59987 Transcript_25806/m.59987 type:complete len:104 (+) Transcript_25806:663-974(+)